MHATHDCLKKHATPPRVTNNYHATKNRATVCNNTLMLNRLRFPLALANLVVR